MATGSSGKSSQVIVLQLLTPGVPAAWPEVEDMAPVTDPAPMGRQRWPVAGSTAQATSCAQPRWRCRSSVQPLQRWVVPIGEGPFGKVRSCAGRRPRRQLWSVSPGARAERVRRCRTLALGWLGVFRRRRGQWQRVLDGEAACPRLRWPWSPRAWSRWPLGCWSPPVWPSAAGCLAWAIAQPCQS